MCAAHCATAVAKRSACFTNHSKIRLEWHWCVLPRTLTWLSIHLLDSTRWCRAKKPANPWTLPTPGVIAVSIEGCADEIQFDADSASSSPYLGRYMHAPSAEQTPYAEMTGSHSLRCEPGPGHPNESAGSIAFYMLTACTVLCSCMRTVLWLRGCFPGRPLSDE